MPLEGRTRWWYQQRTERNQRRRATSQNGTKRLVRVVKRVNRTVRRVSIKRQLDIQQVMVKTARTPTQWGGVGGNAYATTQVTQNVTLQLVGNRRFLGNIKSGNETAVWGTTTAS